MSSEVTSNASSVVPSVPVPEKPVVKSAWSPLAVPIFRSLWIGYVLSQIGMNAREAGAQFLMTELVTSPHERSSWLGYIQTSFYIPVCALSIAAGVWADITDRRRLLILTNLAILLASAALGVITLMGWTTPMVLLFFLFILGIATALSGPAFQYVIPELVPPKDMPLAVSLNSVALNIGRAVGPALGMACVSLVGIMIASKTKGAGAAFLINSLGFVPVVWVLIRWNRPPQKYPGHPETWLGATKIAFKYTTHSPAMRAILIRVVAFILCAVVVWSQMAMIAKVQLRGDAGMIGFLFAAVGFGAVIGVFCMPKMERRFSTDGMVTICTVIYGLALICLSLCRGPAAPAGAGTPKPLPFHTLFISMVLAVIIGFNWVIVPTNFNIATQRSVPAWVKGRAIAMYMTVLFGSFAVGGGLWGRIADLVGISNALWIAGLLIVCGAVLVVPFPLTRARGLDFTPLGHTLPESHVAPGSGALVMRVAYRVTGSRTEDFEKLMHGRLRALRLRNGASRWTLVRRDVARDGGVTFEESMHFTNWHERLRFHARTTRADADQEERLRDFLAFNCEPVLEYEAVATISASSSEAAGISGQISSSQPMVSRKMHHPPPVIDFDHIFRRLLEEFDAMWNRAIRDWHEKRW